MVSSLWDILSTWSSVCDSSKRRVIATKTTHVHHLRSPESLQQSPQTSNVVHSCPLLAVQTTLCLIHMLHNKIEGQVKHQGVLLKPFPITIGLKQGCVGADTLPSVPWHHDQQALVLTSNTNSTVDSSTSPNFVLAQKVPSPARENFSMLMTI